MAGAEAGEARRGEEAVRRSLILFDCDGTLVDSTGVIVRTIRRACRAVGLPEPSEEKARGVIGLSLAAALAAFTDDPARQARLADAYRRLWLEAEGEVRPFPGVPELLARLAARGLLLGVVTGKSRRGLERLLAATELARFFIVSRTPDECPSKPHPAMVEECAAELGLAPRDCVVVGDAVFDIEMARHAGAVGVGVAWGAAPAGALAEAGAFRVVPDVGALERTILELAAPQAAAL